jgi:ribonuclease HI
MEPQSQADNSTQESPWLVYCDGTWGSTKAGAAAILVSPSGTRLRYVARLHFANEIDKCTNSITKYEAILLGLRKLRAISIQTCVLCTDSKVVSCQIDKECIAREPTLEKYLALMHIMENYFKGFTVEYIERNKNTEADELAKAAARNTLMPPYVCYHVLEDASIKTVLPEPRLINIFEGEDSRAPIMAYLRHYYESDSTIKKIRMQQRVRAYQIVDNNLYKASVSGPLLWCLNKAEGQDILLEVHTRSYEGHIGARALAAKILQQGFYWPTMIDDAAKLVSTCEACQNFSH